MVAVMGHCLSMRGISKPAERNAKNPAAFSRAGRISTIANFDAESRRKRRKSQP
jgi:hypothetical protein